MRDQKICSFYISEFHLLTIILPYINEKILEKRDIIIVSEDDLTSNVKKYLKNVENLNIEKEIIKKLEWKKNKKSLNGVNFERKSIFIIGNEEFIESKNKELLLTEDFELINCYKVSHENDLERIAKSYDSILLTDGKYDISKNSHNAQKIETIKSQS